MTLLVKVSPESESFCTFWTILTVLKSMPRSAGRKTIRTVFIQLLFFAVSEYFYEPNLAPCYDIF